MTPNQFLDVARVLPEPTLMLNGEGEILAINKPAAALWGARSQDLQGVNLSEVVQEKPEDVKKYLQSCSRSRKMVVGALTICPLAGNCLLCRSEGAVLSPWSRESPALILLRLEDKTVASNNFLILNQKLEELGREIQQRKQAQEDLAHTNHQLQKALKELKKSQANLVHNEKMSSLGQMVAGIAHEINNPVNFIHGNLDHLEEYFNNLLELVTKYQRALPKPTAEIVAKLDEIELNFIIEDVPKILKSMHEGTRRIQSIVESLRTFSHLDESELKAVDLNHNLDSTLMLFNGRLRNNPHCPIEVIKNYGKLPLIECYPGQLNQVFFNIISNALDAIESKDWSNLNQTPTLSLHTEAYGNCWVKIAIIDNGVGMSKEISSKVFDPFFTTKPVGQGTGLGLSISYQIVVEQHQGELSCHSTPGKGTQFLIELAISRLILEEKVGVEKAKVMI